MMVLARAVLKSGVGVRAGGVAACTHPKTPLWPPLGGESQFITARLSDFMKALV
jgi:hypothetical protein